MSPDVSVVIPAYNRERPLRFTLGSVLAAVRACPAVTVETVLVDDGSEPPLASRLEDMVQLFGNTGFTLWRQPNRGSVAARLTGLEQCRGEFVLFLDSDDLIHPTKLRDQVAAMRASGAQVSYGDTGVVELLEDSKGHDIPPLTRRETLPTVTDALDLFLRIQPPPHGPVYSRQYLLDNLQSPIVPESRTFQSTGETWLYYNLCTRPARVVKVDGALAIHVQHGEDQVSNRWEDLGVSSLGIMLVFAMRCPQTEETWEARKRVGQIALRSWRALPNRFHPGYENLMLSIWNRAPVHDNSAVGGKGFAILARCLGTMNAGNLLRRWQRPAYNKIATIPQAALEERFSRMVHDVESICGKQSLADFTGGSSC